MARMVPPLPAPSRPSNTMITRRPLCFTQSWSLHNSAWSLRNSFMYFLDFSFLLSLVWESLLISLRIRTGDLGWWWRGIERGEISWVFSDGIGLVDRRLLPGHATWRARRTRRSRLALADGSLRLFRG